MPATATQAYPHPFSAPSIPFYLKALFLMSAATTSQPVVVSNPIPDQIIQIGEKYTYDVSNVFSGDYKQLLATGLPDWLNLEYKPLASYPTKTGWVWGVAVSGNTVFVANDKEGLSILEVSDPSKPQLQSTYPINVSYKINVAISSNTLFVASGYELLILNVSNPRKPELLSSYPAGNGTAYGLAISDKTAFVADGPSGVLILNVSNPSYPQYLSCYPAAADDFTWAVAASNNLAFVANAKALLILNVSDPSSPQWLGQYPAKSSVFYNVALSGKTAFISNYQAGLLILNVSDPREPQYLGHYSGWTYVAAISDNTAFLGQVFGLEVLDVSNPSNPQLLGIYLTDRQQECLGIAVSNKTVFLANAASGLQIPNFHAASLRGIPANVKLGEQFKLEVAVQDFDGKLFLDRFQLRADNLPRLVKNTLTDLSISPGSPFSLTFESQQLFNTHDASLVGFSLDRIGSSMLPLWLGLEVNPQLLKIYSSDIDLLYDVLISGSTAFLANGLNGVTILDINDPSNPKRCSTYPVISGKAVGLALSANTLFVANYDAGLFILNVSDPFHPALLSNYTDAGRWTSGLAVSDKTLFVAHDDVGLFILNVSDPFHPQKLGSYATGNDKANAVAVSGQFAFVANGDAGLLILDVSLPSNPLLLGSYPSGSGQAIALALSDNTLFVANYDGLLTLNVSNPSRPQLLSHYSSGEDLITRVSASGDMVFVAGTGLSILNASFPSSPILLSTYPVRNTGIYGIAVTDNTLFVASGMAGLLILSANRWQLKIQANPSLSEAGNYNLALKTIDKEGASVSIPFILRVEGVPKLNGNITWQYAEVGQIFSFDIPRDTFTDPNYDPLVLDLSYSNQTGLPNWLTFNPVSEVLFGKASYHDKGTISLRLTAKDPRDGRAYTNFNLSVVNAPKIIDGQPLTLIQNHVFSHSLALESIFDGNGQAFNYSLEFPDKDKALLQWLNYTISGTNLRLWGAPESSGQVTLLVSAQTALGYQASTPFSLSINPKTPPHFKQAISSQTATVGTPFYFVLPLGTFTDSNGDTLHYNATLADGGPLPDWLRFSQRHDSDEENSWYFTGTPGGWDTNPYWSKAMTIQIAAYNDNDKAIGFFNLTVGGTSTIAWILNFVGPILTFIGLYNSIRNRVCYNQYQKIPQKIEVNQVFSLRLSTPVESVATIEVRTRHILPKGCRGIFDCQRFFKPPINYLQYPFDSLPDGRMLPKGMNYIKDKNALEGILPETIGYRELVVRVKDSSGIVQEQFTIKVEGGVNPPKLAPKQTLSVRGSVNDEESGEYQALGLGS